MTVPPESIDSIKQRILDTAIERLTSRGIDDFDIDDVAAGAGVSAVSVKQIWPNTPDLYSAAITEFARRAIDIPDTGTLRGDLMHYATCYAAALNSPIGRRLIGTVIVSPDDWDISDARAEFRRRRHERVNAMVERGVARGEFAPHIDPGRFMDLLGGCLSMSLLYYNRPITEDDCTEVVDLLLYGGASRR